MEAYKTTCSACGHASFWTGIKSVTGKSVEQRHEHLRQLYTCPRCGSTHAKTGLDHESATGRSYDAIARAFVEAIGKALAERGKGH